MENTFWDGLSLLAENIGFSEIGVAAVTPLDKESVYFEEWLAQGYAADMEYMKKTKDVRKDPHLFFQDARFVLVGTVSYYHPQAPVPNGGKVARYAYGRDYHKVIKKMLVRLTDSLRQQFFPTSTKNDYRLSLDAHPVLERAWAQRAGVGFVGKNSCLITPAAGSWVLIGLLFTNQEIPPKPSKPGVAFDKLSCGSCTRCSRACPTGAIVRPGVIDANKCISYLTIENKGAIPLQYRKAMGDRIFGCDICQEVCPFNTKRDQEAFNPLSEKPIATTALLLSELLSIRTEEEFLHRFAGSPLMRAGWFGMIRNACVVAGNVGNAELLPALHTIATASDPVHGEHARWAIAEIESRSASYR